MEKLRMGLKDWVGLLISFFLLWLTLRNYSFDASANHLTFISSTYLVLACFSVMALAVLAGLRFRLFFRNRSVNPIPSFFIGNFYNQLLPGNLGDLMKLRHLSLKYGTGMKKLLAYWVTEKFLGALVLPVLFIFPFLLLDNVYLKIVSGILITSILMAIAYVCVSYRFGAFKKLPFRLLPIPKARKYLYGIFCTFFYTLRGLVSNRKVFVFFGYTLIYYVGVLLFTYFSVKASLLPDLFTSLEALMLIAVTAIISNFIPSLPSAAGVMHYGLYQSFIILAGHYDITVTAELNNIFILATVVFHSVLFFMDVLLGLPFILKERKWLFGKKNG